MIELVDNLEEGKCVIGFPLVDWRLVFQMQNKYRITEMHAIMRLAKQQWAMKVMLRSAGSGRD